MKTESAVDTLHNFRGFNLLVPNIWILQKNLLKCVVIWNWFVATSWCVDVVFRGVVPRKYGPLVGAGTSHTHPHFIPANIGFS